MIDDITKQIINESISELEKPENKQRIEDLYGDGTWENNLEFYFIKNSSYIMFDNFTLSIKSAIIADH